MTQMCNSKHAELNGINDFDFKINIFLKGNNNHNTHVAYRLGGMT